MLAKLTSKNQLTLPKAVVGQFPGARYFAVRAEKGRIVLVPAKCLEQTFVGGKTIAAGDEIFCALNAANRDPARFPNAPVIGQREIQGVG